MTDSMQALNGVIGLLTPLETEERARILRAAAAFFGEPSPALAALAEDPMGEIADSLPQRARLWMKQNSITSDQLQQVFHFADGGVEVIAPQMPGKNKKEQTYNAYVISGISQFLLKGDAFFEDKAARALCERSGCYDSANHSANLRDRGNEFTGSKEKGWTLTAPGLKRGAEIIKEMQTS
jgi:hypothetical protein